MLRADFQGYLDRLLEPARVRDYCPNGLQVEGRQQIARVACGVTANQALIDAAIAQGADTILVHHGFFWRGEDPRVIGLRRTRLASLLTHEINLFAYHLPLDLHPELGNNAQLALKAGWVAEARFGEQDLGWLGRPERETSAGGLAHELAGVLAREPLLIGEPGRVVRRIAWCSGAAQSMFEEAIAAGADVFVSGEISEQTVHLARESGVAYLAAGHHATERGGIQALSRRLVRDCGLACEFIDIDSPV
jgi:dinuclear metal center YbgI/SA1388 family protein